MLSPVALAAHVCCVLCCAVLCCLHLQGSMQGLFELRGLNSGNIIQATVGDVSYDSTALSSVCTFDRWTCRTCLQCARTKVHRMLAWDACCDVDGLLSMLCCGVDGMLSMLCLQVPAFALTPTAMQLSDPQIIYDCVAQPVSG
jgi:hypothetical protein